MVRALFMCSAGGFITRKLAKRKLLTALHKLDKRLDATVMKEMETLLRSETMKRLLSECLIIMIMLRNINYLPK